MGNTRIGRIGEMLLYLLGFWAALAVMTQTLPWAPAGAFMQSARILLLLAASVALLISAIGGTAGLLGLLGHLSPKDPAPRP
jgi:hypothetical protein